MRKIFFDFDGTILDSRRRLYTLFQELVPQSNLSFEQYWDLKRSKVRHEEILSRFFPDMDFSVFNEAWMSKIESPDMLRLDFPYPETISVLQQLKPLNELYIVTARQLKQSALEQISQLNLSSYFVDILVTGGGIDKKSLINQFETSPSDFMIGDTGHDIKTGQSCDLKTVGITHGFMSRSSLLPYHPDYLINNLTELLDILR